MWFLLSLYSELDKDNAIAGMVRYKDVHPDDKTMSTSLLPNSTTTAIIVSLERLTATHTQTHCNPVSD